MKVNPYIPYYVNQGGTGLSYFSGSRYQRGHGIGAILASLFRSALLPAVKGVGKYLGKQALQTGVDIGSDVLGGIDIKSALKSRGKETGGRILDKAVKRLQTGSGSRKRHNKRNKTTKRPNKSTKKGKNPRRHHSKLLYALNKNLQ